MAVYLWVHLRGGVSAWRCLVQVPLHGGALWRYLCMEVHRGGASACKDSPMQVPHHVSAYRPGSTQDCLHAGVAECTRVCRSVRAQQMHPRVGTGTWHGQSHPGAPLRRQQGSFTGTVSERPARLCGFRCVVDERLSPHRSELFKPAGKSAFVPSPAALLARGHGASPPRC